MITLGSGLGLRLFKYKDFGSGKKEAINTGFGSRRFDALVQIFTSHFLVRAASVLCRERNILSRADIASTCGGFDSDLTSWYQWNCILPSPLSCRDLVISSGLLTSNRLLLLTEVGLMVSNILTAKQPAKVAMRCDVNVFVNYLVVYCLQSRKRDQSAIASSLGSCRSFVYHTKMGKSH